MSDLFVCLCAFIDYALKHTTLKGHKQFGEMTRDLMELVKKNDAERVEDKALLYRRREHIMFLYRQLRVANFGDEPDFELIARSMDKAGFDTSQEPFLERE